MTVAQDSAARGVSKRDPAVRAIARAWRELTGGGRERDGERRTLIACSGGGDSSGLALALAAAVARPAEVFVIGHIVHDMRGRGESLADRDAARALAERLGIPFAEAEVAVRGLPGNAEAAARRLRYRALERMAVEHGCGFIAVAHHAEDQLETMLMALVRGAGPRGLAGMASRRRAGSVRVVRPALRVGREDMRALCRAAEWKWREDATNQDETRLRAAIRHRVIPELERLRPGAARRASRGSDLIRGASSLVQGQARQLLAGGPSWTRGTLRGVRAVVLGDLIRLAGGKDDRMSAAAVGRVVRAIRDRGTEPRVFALGGIQVRVTARTVVVSGMREGVS